ncbi:MAG: DUF6803 family protein [Eubacteriales bacterium]
MNMTHYMELMAIKQPWDLLITKKSLEPQGKALWLLAFLLQKIK